MYHRIRIFCPATSVPVPTGFRARRDTDISALKRVTMRFCPACGQDHVWNGENAFWVEYVTKRSKWRLLDVWRPVPPAKKIAHAFKERLQNKSGL